ncbi:protein of unknown function [Candidatus Methylocalor cossyra]|uniref:Uncharacterized protein n=1 Tax=Candidatus Methylocalor cossyra TaxID=3108543 RepID=A0ABM9NM02_9GAMM
MRRRRRGLGHGECLNPVLRPAMDRDLARYPRPLPCPFRRGIKAFRLAEADQPRQAAGLETARFPPAVRVVVPRLRPP